MIEYEKEGKNMKKNLVKKAAICMTVVMCAGNFSPTAGGNVSVHAATVEISDDTIGKYVSQGYENPEYGFKVQLPESYVLEARESAVDLVEDENEDVVEKSNKDGAYAQVRLSAMNGATVFAADSENTTVIISLQTPGIGKDYWDEEEVIAESTAATYEQSLKDSIGDAGEITDFEMNHETFDFLGKTHARGLLKCQINGIPYYAEEIYLRAEDKKTILSISIGGFDANELIEAESYFTTME